MDCTLLFIIIKYVVVPVRSNALQHHGLQHARLPCPSYNIMYIIVIYYYYCLS